MWLIWYIKCILSHDPLTYRNANLFQDADGMTRGYFWGYEEEVMAKKFDCLSVQNEIKTFTSFLNKETKGRTVMIHRAESLTHGRYSEWSKEWWAVGHRLTLLSGHDTPCLVTITCHMTCEMTCDMNCQHDLSSSLVRWLVTGDSVFHVNSLGSVIGLNMAPCFCVLIQVLQHRVINSFLNDILSKKSHRELNSGDWIDSVVHAISSHRLILPQIIVNCVAYHDCVVFFNFVVWNNTLCVLYRSALCFAILHYNIWC